MYVDMIQCLWGITINKFFTSRSIMSVVDVTISPFNGPFSPSGVFQWKFFTPAHIFVFCLEHCCRKRGWTVLQSTLAALASNCTAMAVPDAVSPVLAAQLLKSAHYHSFLFILFLFLITPAVCGSSNARDRTRARAATWATTVVTPDPYPRCATRELCFLKFIIIFIKIYCFSYTT